MTGDQLSALDRRRELLRRRLAESGVAAQAVESAPRVQAGSAVDSHQASGACGSCKPRTRRTHRSISVSRIECGVHSIKRACVTPSRR